MWEENEVMLFRFRCIILDLDGQLLVIWVSSCMNINDENYQDGFHPKRSSLETLLVLKYNPELELEI